MIIHNAAFELRFYGRPWTDSPRSSTRFQGAGKSPRKSRTPKSSYLRVVDLNRNETAELYAARELFAEAVQGNVPFKGDEVLTFLGEQLMPWWNRLRS